MRKVINCLMAFIVSILLLSSNLTAIAATNNTSSDSATLTLVGNLPTPVPNFPPRNNSENPVSNGRLQKVNTDVHTSTGDVQTGVAQPDNTRTLLMIGLIGVILSIIAGYLGGLRLKLYRTED